MHSEQPALFLPQDTYRVSVLTEELQTVLQQTYSSIWVVGEIQKPSRSARGHLYFDMVKKGARDSIVGKLSAVVWGSDLRRISGALQDEGDVFSEGLEVRCRGNLDFYPPRGALQFVVREVDPLFTLGLLARRRQAVLAELRESGLLERNQALDLASVPLDVGLVTSADSAAYHDLMSTLAESGYRFRITLAPVSVQGERAAGEIRRALARLSRVPELDCIALVRGGGSRTDLAAFDAMAVAEAVCRSPLPVLAGLGHETDQSVTDMVAYRSFKTPTSVGEFLVRRVEEAHRCLTDVQARLLRQAELPLERCRRRLGDLERELRRSGQRIERDRLGLDTLRQRLAGLARVEISSARQRERRVVANLSTAPARRLSAARAEVKLQWRRLGDLSGSRAREQRSRLDHLGRLLRELSPQRTLRRGFSITRNADGQVLRSGTEARPGETLRTELARGSLSSRVVEVGESS